MRDFVTEKYEVVASIDEAFKRIQTNAAALKNAENPSTNRVTLIKIKDEVKNIENRYDYYDILCREEEEAIYAMEEEDDPYSNNGFDGTGSDFLGF